MCFHFAVWNKYLSYSFKSNVTLMQQFCPFCMMLVIVCVKSVSVLIVIAPNFPQLKIRFRKNPPDKIITSP